MLIGPDKKMRVVRNVDRKAESGEYLQALHFGFRGSIGPGFGGPGFSRIHWKVLGLALFILWSSVISSLASPSSAVLMIPRVDWNFFDKKTYSPPAFYGIFPNIFDQYVTSVLPSHFWFRYRLYTPVVLMYADDPISPNSWYR